MKNYDFKHIKVIETNVPHIPYNLVDCKNNHIATLSHHNNSKEFSELFAKSPELEHLLYRVLDEIVTEEKELPISIDLLSDITKALNVIAETRRPPSLHGETFKRVVNIIERITYEN